MSKLRHTTWIVCAFLLTVMSSLLVFAVAYGILIHLERWLTGRW
jgi:hypothetical protein